MIALLLCADVWLRQSAASYILVRYSRMRSVRGSEQGAGRKSKSVPGRCLPVATYRALMVRSSSASAISGTCTCRSFSASYFSSIYTLRDLPLSRTKTVCREQKLTQVGGSHCGPHFVPSHLPHRPRRLPLRPSNHHSPRRPRRACYTRNPCPSR